MFAPHLPLIKRISIAPATFDPLKLWLRVRTARYNSSNESRRLFLKGSAWVEMKTHDQYTHTHACIHTCKHKQDSGHGDDVEQVTRKQSKRVAIR